MSQKYFPKIHTSGFTLVELIVVITILVILGTIGFVQLQGFAGSARDSARIENLSNLHKWLSLFQIVSGTYPMPENPVNITASGTIIGYQGFAKEQVEWVAKLSPGATKDPLDATMYTTYSVNGDRTKMQLMAFLEDSSTVTAFVPGAFASSSSDYNKRTPTLKGDTLGILLASGSLQPVQESGTGVDIVNTTGNYSMQFDRDTKISGTGIILKSGIVSTKGLVGYWDMETLSGGLLRDLSGNGNNGSMSGTMSASGKVGYAKSFDGVSDYIEFPDSDKLDVSTELSISGWMYQIATDVSDRDVINKGNWNNSNYTLRVSEGKLRFYFGHGGAFQLFVTNNSVISPGWWNYFAITYRSGDLNSVKIYVNGISQSFYRYNPGTGSVNLFVNNDPIHIGSYDGTRTAFKSINWFLDEVRIYKRALSDSEIQTLYNATK